jgi:hypothetical protein
VGNRAAFHLTRSDIPGFHSDLVEEGVRLFQPVDICGRRAEM